MEKEQRRIALRLTGVGKTYTLGQIGSTTLTARLQSHWARLQGKEDPNTKLGAPAVTQGKPFTALDHIDLTVYEGEVVGIIGSNGAGKSTLLKLLSQITAPTTGTIELHGRVASMLEVGTGFHGEMTGRENIYLNGAILGMTRQEIDAKMEQIIAFSEIGHFIDTPVKRYSSGMYVRLAFAVAAHLESEILILDEVLAVGDMAFQSKCLRKVGDTRGKTVLYVSHNMHTVRQLCTRCILLERGRILYDGDVETAISLYLRNQRQQLQNKVALDTLPRAYAEHGSQLKMTAFAFENSCELPLNTPLAFALTVQSQIARADVCFRCMVCRPDGSPVGMATTKTGAIRLRAGEQTLRGQVDVSALAPGSYYLKLALYRVNEFGTEAHFDVVDRAVPFSVADGAVTNQMQWSHRWWGDIRLPDITVY